MKSFKKWGQNMFKKCFDPMVEWVDLGDRFCICDFIRINSFSTKYSNDGHFQDCNVWWDAVVISYNSM